MYKIRFNLKKGKNYLKWKVTFPDGSVEHYDPFEYNLYMTMCKMRNRPATAHKIYNGANKEICAWIEADSVSIEPINNDKFGEMMEPIFENSLVSEVSYNPKKAPYWVKDGEDVDNEEFLNIASKGKKLYVI